MDNNKSKFIKTFWFYTIIIMVSVFALSFLSACMLFGYPEADTHYVMISFLLFALAAILGVAIAFFYLKRLVSGVFDESIRLKDSLSEYLSDAKERLLSNFLRNIRDDMADDADNCSKYGIDFPYRHFTVVTMGYTQDDNADAASQESEASSKEIGDYIISLAKDAHMCCEAVRASANAVSYILNYEHCGSAANLSALLSEISVRYGVTVNFGIGDEVDSIDKLFASYEGSVSALRFGMRERPGSTVYYEEIQNLESSKIYYTGEKEKQLIRGIKTGSVNSVSETLDEIYNVNFCERHISHNNLKRLVFNMSLTVYKVLDEAYESDDAKHEKYRRICLNMYCNDNPQECFAILREVCLSLSDGIVKKTGEDGLRSQIVDYIANNYSDDSLSLEMLAEHLGMSYHYLSRLFNEHLGTNFVSYLTLVRLEKAKELLKSTDNTIENIAEQTGFVSSNSLIRAFKKYFAVTPGRYRKS